MGLSQWLVPEGARAKLSLMRPSKDAADRLMGTTP